MRNNIKIKDFPQTFWIANTMEIFERMSWYGFFTVSSLYITGSVASGGLGFSEEDRGVLQGVTTFFLYLFPVVTGALADRYGFKKMLISAYLVMIPAYYLLGQFTTFPTFFLAFLLVALGAAMFKPVIIGTISTVTNEKTASIGFGIFYMMVNIGGFIGPIIAGLVRAMDWNYVFISSSLWAFVNLILVSIFYKEPTQEKTSKSPRNLKVVLSDMVEVLGNGRFFLFIFGLLFILVMGSKFTSDGTFTWSQIWLTAGLWLVINLVFDHIIKISGKKSQGWYFQKMKTGDWKFGLFLLLMSGFWTSFNQIFMTLPNYIRDFVDTSSMLNDVLNFVAAIGINLNAENIRNSMAVPGQINPEYIINLNAGAIILFQVFVSYAISKLKPFTTIFWGVLITSITFFTFVMGESAWLIIAGLLIFSFGEMMASPKSKEYTGKIAPPGKVALYMGYFYWCVALGNLFGGILSGQFYGLFARDMRNPDLMWIMFAILAIISALLILIYDKTIIKNKAR